MTKRPDATLHWFPGTCSRVVLIALEEVGLEYETRLARIDSPEGRAAYKSQVNPKGKVPALEIDGRLLTENPAIHTYLHARFPGAELLPADPDQGLDALMMMSWFAAGVHPPIFRSRFPIGTTTALECHDSIRETALDNLRDCFRQLEERLGDREWLFDSWTIVDAYMLWLWYRAVGSGLTAKEFPRVDGCARRCQQRPSAVTTLDREAETLATLEAQGMQGLPPLQAGWLPA
jgi:glutathione S-transferase